MYVAAGKQWEITFDGLATGLVGTIGYRVQNGQGSTTVARTTVGIVESPAGSGVYQITGTAPSNWAIGDFYVLIVDTGGVTPVYKTVMMEVTSTGLAPLVAGTVSESVKNLMPLTWRALFAASYYGEARLLQRINVGKYKAFPSSVAESDESTWTVLMIEYAAMYAALEIIPAGIEYWMNQQTSVSTTGTNENVSFTDRANQLKDLAEWLQKQVTMLASNPDVVGYLREPTDVPDVSYPDDDDMLTSNPYDFPRAFSPHPNDASSLLFGAPHTV